MSNQVTVLVSNTPIPSNRIGSWVTRINTLIKNHDCFDYILSPSNTLPKNIFCKKRKFISYHKWIRKKVLFNWVAKDYLRTLSKLSEEHSAITVVVMDDPHLIEAIALKKAKFKGQLKIIFSFHGFQLKLRQEIVAAIDKVLFLSKAGRDKSIANYVEFSPKTEVVWNGVDSSLFYPLEDMKRTTMRNKLGFTKDHLILAWMANDRPLKGFHLFRKMVLELLSKYDYLKVITMGTQQKIDHPSVLNVGRLPHGEIPNYLQLTDIYAFTSLYEEGFGLSMIEALKCGNIVIASSLGAIPNVLSGLARCYFVNDPYSSDEWIARTASVINNFSGNRISISEADDIWNYRDWQVRFISAIIN
ncbi:glycosyltransferase family 4 protein [Aureitalea sp. L0-47]|uniref:glycosyltransferase family 4 protein n=1 Tax=Aureitalea sp. L0-47 TaxID=2816962 RepID=UPI0022374789|nr:glycosyltransferase family 4 protein [Aureitalea sp. L0-47]MCW5519172.1 glycosyltransferase family 4 protein [Aureitalea sp. L0-47]